MARRDHEEHVSSEALDNPEERVVQVTNEVRRQMCSFH